MIQAWTATTEKNPYTVPEDDWFKAYCTLSGYTGEQSPTPGVACLDALNYWRKTGLGEHKIHAFVGLRTGHREDIQQAIHMFGTAFVRLALPNSAKPKMTTSGHLLPWAVQAPDQGLWVNHAVSAVKYTETDLTVVTWGYEQTMSWEFYETYGQEAFAALSREWIGENGMAPNSLHVEKLEAYLNILSVWGALREVDNFDPHSAVNTTVYPLKRRLERFRGSGGQTEELFPYLWQLAQDDEEAHRLRVFFEESLAD